jgi:hypothetical protein
LKIQECPSKSSAIPSKLRPGIALTIVLIVVSSPIVILVNPTLVAASSSSSKSTDPTSFSVPSTIIRSDGANGGSDFTTQAALSSVTAKQSNNIVNTRSYYDITFTTGSGGSIKDIIIDFPAGTVIGVSGLLVERQGIGPGTATKTGPLQITYTVTNPVNIPPGTIIRLELSTIDNPPDAGASYKVSVTTKRPVGTTIDGPTPSTAYKIKQIGTNDIADLAITTSKLATFSVTNSKVFPDSFTLPVAQRPGPIVNMPPNSISTAQASCLFGETLVGGGSSLVSADEARDYRFTREFSPTFNVWQVEGANAASGAMTFQAVALCAQPFP